jgi:hypothetical protein
MPAGKYSILIEQGSTFSIELAYKDSTGIPINLTGYSGKMQIRPSVDANDVYITLSSSLQPDGTGINFSGSYNLNPPTSGTIGLYISARSSSLFNFNEGVYDLEISSGSYTTRILEGQVKLSKEVTR